MGNKIYIASTLVVIAIAFSFFAGNIGFGFQSQALPAGQLTLASQDCDLVSSIEEWKDGDLELSELLGKMDEWQSGVAC